MSVHIGPPRTRAKKKQALSDQRSEAFHTLAPPEILTRLYASKESCKDVVRMCALNNGVCTEQWWATQFKERFQSYEASEDNAVPYAQLSMKDNYRLFCQFGGRENWDNANDNFMDFDNTEVYDSLGYRVDDSDENDIPAVGVYRPLGLLEKVSMLDIAPSGHTIRRVDINILLNVEVALCAVNFEACVGNPVAVEFRMHAVASMEHIRAHLALYRDLYDQRTTIIASEALTTQSVLTVACREWTGRYHMYMHTLKHLVDQWQQSTLSMSENKWVLNAANAVFPTEVLDRLNIYLRNRPHNVVT